MQRLETFPHVPDDLEDDLARGGWIGSRRTVHGQAVSNFSRQGENEAQWVRLDWGKSFVERVFTAKNGFVWYFRARVISMGYAERDGFVRIARKWFTMREVAAKNGFVW